MTLRKFLFQNAAEFFAEEQAAADELALGKITFSGVGGVAIDGGGAEAVNFLDPTTAQSLATKAYVDAVGTGFRDFKDSVRVATTANITLSGEQTIDGVLTAASRVLVKDQTLGANNGIYVSAAGAWTRATDADASAEVTAGMYMFVEEGTANGDTSWVLSTNNPIVLGTTVLVFTQFASLSSLNALAGLLRSGNNLSVEVDTGADAQGAGSDGGSSGLEFDVTGASGKLRAAVGPTAGLQRTASGLGVKLNGTTLQSGASGVSVKGLPALFEVATVAVGANVTAPNLDTLNSAGNADALHFHESVAFERITGANFAKGVAGYYTANNELSPGDSSADAKSRILGLAAAAIVSPASGKFVKTGPLTGVLSGATFNTRYYLGHLGTPVLAGALVGGDRTVQVGIAKNATDLDVQIFDYGKKI